MLKKHIPNEKVDTKVKIDAIKILLAETNQNIDNCKSELYDEFSYFEIRKELSKFQYYLKELKKAYSKNKITSDSYRLAYEYYKKKLAYYWQFIEKIRILVKAYLGVLYNRNIDLKLELNQLKEDKKKFKFTKEQFKRIRNSIDQKLNIIRKKRDFFHWIYYSDCSSDIR